MAAPKYLTTKELLEKLQKIDEVDAKLDRFIEENNRVHEEFHEEFVKLFNEEEIEIGELKTKLGRLYDRYFAAKRRFNGE